LSDFQLIIQGLHPFFHQPQLPRQQDKDDRGDDYQQSEKPSIVVWLRCFHGSNMRRSEREGRRKGVANGLQGRCKSVAKGFLTWK
jgi:hypothetical protein